MTFSVQPPSVSVFNPVSSRLTEYEVKTADGTLVAVASTTPGDARVLLPLGSLIVTPKPVDMVMSLFSGSELNGMARIRDVVVQKNKQLTYPANVRKPLVFVGASLPAEGAPGNVIGDGKILDFTPAAADLEHPRSPSGTPPRMPDGTNAAAVTSDGTLLLAGRNKLLTVYDTGSGTTEDVPLSFTPVRVVVAPRDVAVAVLDPGDATGGAVALFTDVEALRSGVATPLIVKLPNVNPRTATFGPDGQTLYVLGGGNVDPCEPGTPPAANNITLVSPAGQITNTWNLPDFVSDLSSDGVGLLVSRSVANQVARMTPSADTGAPTPQKLFDARCPTALRAENGEVLVVTSARSTEFENAFELLRAPLDAAAAPTPLAIGAPIYNVPTEDTPLPSPMPDQPMLSITVPPTSISSYDLAVTPDGSRAVFAARVRYHQANDHFTILGTDCTANLDIVEYGLYVMDTASGNASYEPRSQIVTSPASSSDACITCPTIVGDVDFFCPTAPGDRPAGLAAIFGGP